MRNRSGSVSVLLLTFLLSCTSSEKAKQRYLTKANELAQSGKASEARLNYKKALQKDPRFGEAQYRLGLLELKENQIWEAYNALNLAVSLSPENQEAKVAFANLCLKMYLTDPHRTKTTYDRVVSLSTDLLQKNPQSYDGLRLKGYVAVLDRLPTQAIEYFERARAIHPLDRETTLVLAQTLTQAGDDKQSEQVLRSAIEADRTYGPTYDVLYLQFLKRKEIAAAEQLLKDKVGANPKEPAYVLELAAHYASAGKAAASKDTIDQLLNRENEFPNVRRLAGEFYLRRGNLDEALAHFRAGLQQHPEDAVSYRKRIVSVLLNQGKRDEAIDVAEAILKEIPTDNDVLLTRANLWIGAGNADKVRAGLKDLQDISKRDAKFPGVHLAIGKAQLLLGDLASAKAELFAAAQEKESFVQAQLLLAETEIRNNHGKEGLAHADTVIARQPENRPARLLRVKALMAMGNTTLAGSALDAYRKDHPQDLDGQLQNGLLQIALKKYDASEATFRKFYRPGQKDLRPLEGLVDTYIAARKPDAALALLQEELKQSNGSATIRNVLASTAAAFGHDDLAIKHFEELRAQYPNSAGTLVQLAKLYQRNGHVDQSTASLEKASQLAPKNAPIQAILAGNLGERGRRDDAIAQYRKSLELNPQNPAVMNNLAMLLAEDPQHRDEALTLANQAQEKAPSHPSIADTVGWIYLKKNQYDSAMQIFGNLSRKYPENGTFHYHYGAALLAKGDKSKAKQELQNALAKNMPTADRQAVLILLKGI